MPYYDIGFSASDAPSCISACRRVLHCKGRAVQVTFKDPSDWRAANFTIQNADIIRAYIKKHRIKLANHSQYTINFARKPADVAHERASLVNDLQNCDAIGGIGCVIHMGKMVAKYKLTLEQAIQNMADNIVAVLKAAGQLECKLIVETAAGQGSEMCTELADIGRLWAAIPEAYRDGVGFCVDTCHVFAAGTCDLNSRQAISEFFAEWDRLIGIHKIALIHLNNSEGDCGCCKDRHAPLEEGLIDADRLRQVVTFAAKHKIPCVLETHSVHYDQEMKLMHAWLQNPVDLTQIHIPLDKQEADVSKTQMTNNKLAEQLYALSDYYKTEREIWRSKSYKSAADAIRNYPVQIKSGDHAKALAIPGVGKSTCEKIQEILDTDTLAILEEHKEEMQIKNMFMAVWGAGQAAANKWYKAGLRTLDEVLESGDYTDQQRIGIKYFHDIPKRIPRERVHKFDEQLQQIVGKIVGKSAGDIVATIAGSYRRGSPTCGDIDILVSSSAGKSVSGYLVALVKALRAAGYIADDLTSVDADSKTFMCVCNLNPGDADKPYYRRMDIKVYPRSEWAFALLYFTGSYQLNIRMRDIAISKGYKLSDKELVNKRTGKRVLLKTEEEIFKWCDMEYLKPNERN